jgi:uncharacterized protein (TIGR02594 family)
MLGIEIAEEYMGLQQNRDNDRLRAFFEANSINGDIAIDPNTTAWCAAFVNACERKALRTGTGKLNAQSFLTYGTNVDNWNNVQKGDILVFHFPFDSPAQGHVTYFESWDDDNNLVACLGGNQNHMVCISHYVQDYIEGIRRSP